jgi:4-hydroxybenzoate polyprenyltransferase
MLIDWLKLVRVTGLVTILTNITAAVVTAVYASEGLDPLWLLKRIYQGGATRVLWLVSASCMLYCAGMLWNDLADVERDRVLHPRRPLPSGRIGLGSAFLVGVLLSVGALVCAALVDAHAFYAAGVVLSLIFLYNLATKDIPYLGSLTMAAVRFTHAIFALLLLGTDYLKLAVLGQSAPGHGSILAYPIILGCYILGVTLVSELESRKGRRVELVLGGALMFGAILGAGMLLAHARWISHLSQSDSTLRVVGSGLAAVLGAVLFLWVLRMVAKPWLAALRSGRSEQVGPVVGAALGGMLFLDALVATSAHPVGGLLILALLPVFMLGRRVVRMD